MSARRAAAAALLALALGCAGETSPSAWPEVPPDVPSPEVPPVRQPAPDAPPPTPGAVPERPSAARAEGVEGVWVGEPCGRRNYVRHLELGPGGVARLEERISPCPAGARCVWSGIEVIEGRWARRDDGVVLALDEARRPMAIEPPARLVVTSEAGRLVLAEPGGCRYAPVAPAAGPETDPAPLP